MAKKIKDIIPGTEPKVKKKPKIRNTINKLSVHEVRKAVRDTRTLERIFKENPGFVESAVLSVIQKQNNHPEIDDLIQIGRISLWKAATKYDESKGKFGTFAYKVIQNGVRQELKTLNRKTEKNISFDGLQQYNKGDDANGSGGFWENKFVETRQIAQLRNFESVVLTELILKDQFQGLNTFEQCVFNMRFLEKKSLAKIATELDINESRLRKWFYSGGGKLKLDSVMGELNG